MKSDRRHELQQNVLASYLAQINRSVEPYSRLIAVVVGTVLIAAIAYGLYTSKASGDRSDATWQLIMSANTRDAETIAAVADTYPQTAAGAWSRLYEADQYLSDGMRSLYLNRDEALSQLDEAGTAYRSALAMGDDRLLRSRARFGLARVAESLGEIDEAIAEYGECIAVNESEAMVELAQRRADALSKPQTREFLAWFSEQDFSPADPSLPPSLPSGVSLPDLPDLNLPELGDDEDRANLKDGGITMPKKETDESAKTDKTDKDDSDDKPNESDAESKDDAKDNAADKKDNAADKPDADSAESKSSEKADAPAESDDDSADGKGDAAKSDPESTDQPATDDPS